MKTIILLSHGELAKGMADTAQMIMGKQKNLYAISAYTEENVNFPAMVKKLIQSSPGETVLVTDLMGGSVNNQMIELAAQTGAHLISGMNLTLVLSLLNDDPSLSASQWIELALSDAKNGIVYCSRLSQPVQDDDF